MWKAHQVPPLLPASQRPVSCLAMACRLDMNWSLAVISPPPLHTSHTCLSMPHLRVFTPIFPSAGNALASDICVHHSLTFFKALLSCDWIRGRPFQTAVIKKKKHSTPPPQRHFPDPHSALFFFTALLPYNNISEILYLCLFNMSPLLELKRFYCDICCMPSD